MNTMCDSHAGNDFRGEITGEMSSYWVAVELTTSSPTGTSYYLRQGPAASIELELPVAPGLQKGMHRITYKSESPLEPLSDHQSHCLLNVRGIDEELPRSVFGGAITSWRSASYEVAHVEELKGVNWITFRTFSRAGSRYVTPLNLPPVRYPFIGRPHHMHVHGESPRLWVV
ncbi:hypothetical protein BDN72DRAFT_893055 [Pluteus cervinus]|uniref:Uncharacterized protein n=1 Tax=Pluteus cervinus TaxID=181527 RepID=A0ACD3B8V5_9AGAR|nr:hypothetical protein BDN72DRAFT_893055 [Pluteus cervinus]